MLFQTVIFATRAMVSRGYMHRKLLLLPLILTFFSCSDYAAEESVTWIGGEIVNPKLDYVLLFKNECLLDTLPLNPKNFFLYEAKDLTEGVYAFQHYEYQLFYIRPGDSLMLRVNTVDFDESLTFSGKGGPRNNLMIEMFLINESEDKLMPQWYALSPVEFNQKIDSLRSVREGIYQQYVEKENPVDAFKELVESCIDYDMLSRRELYISANTANPQWRSNEYVPADFLAYRSNVDYGNEDMRGHYSYYRFLNRLLDNLSYEQYREVGYFNRNSFTHNYVKVQLIDSLVLNDSLKNNMLRTNVRRYLVNAKSAEKEQNMLDLFLTTNTNKRHQNEMQRLAKATMSLTPNHTIPNINLVTTDNRMKDLHSTFKRPTVIYFWSSESIQHYRNIHSRANELRNKHPEFDFIGINTDTNFKKWRSIVKKSGYNDAYEFQFETIEDAHEVLVLNSMNKAIVVDKNGMILEGNTNLFNRYIEDQLLGFAGKN